MVRFRYRFRGPVSAEDRARFIAEGRQAVECAHGIGREVDVRAHTHELAGLLIDRDGVPLSTQSDGSRQAANAGTNNADVQTKRHVHTS